MITHHRPRTTASLFIALNTAAGRLPTSFRLFAAGWNDTEKGSFLFDAAAAKAVMAAYRKWGVDIAIDLEHQMLDPIGHPDPTARDARGWCKLELRADGSLWATSVTWTSDGAARLTDKRQRYVSPAFEVDPETKRVVAIMNVAITSIPATHHTPALVAASKRDRTMNAAQAVTPIRTPLPKDVPAAIAKITKALELPDNADSATIRAALDACLQSAGESAPAAVEQAALLAGLSPREAKMLAGMGYTTRSIGNYIALAAKHGMRGGR